MGRIDTVTWSQTAVSSPALHGQMTDSACASVSLLTVVAVILDSGMSGGTEQATRLQALPAVCSIVATRVSCDPLHKSDLVGR